MAQRLSLIDVIDEFDRRFEVPPIEVPRSFIAFCAFASVQLEPAQRVIGLVCYDGVQPGELDGHERELARQIFGAVETIPEAARRVIVAVCGRRGGKSYTLVALRLVQALYTVPLVSVAPGQIPIALVIAPRDDLRQEVVNYALGVVRACPALAMTLVGRARSVQHALKAFNVRRPGTGEIVGFRSGVATHGGYGGRGKSLVGAALDECAFFRSDKYTVNDVDIFKAILPGLLPDAQAILASTPWAEVGLLHEEFTTNYGHPRTAIAAHAPTVLLRPSMAPLVERERMRDPEYVLREYDAVFMSTGTIQFFSATVIDSCLDRDMPFPVAAQHGMVAAAAVDLGFRSDSSAFCGTIVLPYDPTIRIGQLKEGRPRDGKPLRPSEIIDEFADLASRLGCSYVMADQHYLESLRENASRLPVAPAPAAPSDVYIAARTLMRDGRVKIPHPDIVVGEAREAIVRLIAQLKEVQGRPLPGGGFQIVLPRWRTGGHGDLVSAYVLAVFQMGGSMPAAPPAREGSEQWEREQLELRKQKAREKSSRLARVGGRY